MKVDHLFFIFLIFFLLSISCLSFGIVKIVKDKKEDKQWKQGLCNVTSCITGNIIPCPENERKCSNDSCQICKLYTIGLNINSSCYLNNTISLAFPSNNTFCHDHQFSSLCYYNCGKNIQLNKPIFYINAYLVLSAIALVSLVASLSFLCPLLYKIIKKKFYNDYEIL